MKSKKKVALVGLGTNSANYHEGFIHSRNLELVVVCDSNPNAISRNLYNNIPFVEDYRLIAENYDIEYVFIVTPPNTHLEIASFFLRRKIAVIIEKPPFPSYRDLYRLNGSSNSKRTSWTAAYHWQFGPEIEYFKNVVMPKMGKLLSASTIIFDPYFKDGQILPEKVGLLGTWLDSGSNALSVFDCLIKNFDPKLSRKEFKYDEKSGMSYYCEVDFTNGSQSQFKIVIDWTMGLNHKESIYVFEKGTIILEHSKQKIIENAKVIASFDSRPRLLNHYFNMLEKFSFAELTKRKLNRKTLRFLYEVNEK